MPSTWKNFERYVCRKFFNVERAGPVGRTGPDCAHSIFAVECRQRRTISYKDIEDWVVEVRREKGDRTFPILAVRRLRGAGQPAPTLFVLDEQSFMELITKEYIGENRGLRDSETSRSGDIGTGVTAGNSDGT